MNRLMLMAMGGYGDMGMMDAAAGGGGVIESLKAKLSFLPGWASILVIAVLVILAAMLVGWIGGKIIGSILYPDPEKQSILSKKQKFLVLGGDHLCPDLYPGPQAGGGFAAGGRRNDRWGAAGG